MKRIGADFEGFVGRIQATSEALQQHALRFMPRHVDYGEKIPVL